MLETITPEEFAAQMGWSARHIRQLARQIGACHILGNRMILTREDVDAILEATKPKPLGPRPQTYLQSLRSSPGPRLPEGDYEDLVRFRDKQKREQQKPKRLVRPARLPRWKPPKDEGS
jgi:hypothetical protein